MTDTSDIGQMFYDRRTELMSALADARRRLEDFDDAWSSRDYAWLRDAGFLTPEKYKRMTGD